MVVVYYYVYLNLILNILDIGIFRIIGEMLRDIKFLEYT